MKAQDGERFEVTMKLLDGSCQSSRKMRAKLSTWHDSHYAIGYCINSAIRSLGYSREELILSNIIESWGDEPREPFSEELTKLESDLFAAAKAICKFWNDHDKED